MKTWLTCFFSLALLFSAITRFPLFARADISATSDFKQKKLALVEVRTDTNFRPVHILPPSTMLSPQSPSATFQINYLSAGTYEGDNCIAWPNDAKTAFTYAANIWASLLSSPVPIVIDACWATNLGSGVLGHSGALSYRRDFANAPQSNVWYAIALANALSGSDLEPGEADIYIAYSSTFAWYFGTDGATPPGKYDFVSVVLHEIAHGLGFSGSMNYGSSYCGGATFGCWGEGTSYPDTYDTFIQNGSGNNLLNTSLFPNPSTALGSQLTSNNLYFNGSNAKAANGGNRPKMYAPASWMPGSSYSHLDYDTFASTPHRLMVYAISDGASIHHPGSITLGILQDVGWNRPTSGNPSNVYLPLTLKPQSGPDAGYWKTSVGSRYFYVSTDRAYVNLYTIYVTLSGGACDGQTWRIWKTSSLPITNNQFSFSGALNGNGTFLSTTSATVTDRITNLYIQGCGTFSGGPWTNSFTWQNSSQPAAEVEADSSGLQALRSEEFPAVEIYYTP
ncbi:MAG: hypothetical protein Kow0088_16230 [Anaerolineales bacterium]